MLYLTSTLKKRSSGPERRLVWITFTHFDSFLHRWSFIEAIKHLADRGFDVDLFALRSRTRFHTTDSRARLRLVPLIYFPVATSFLFAVTMILMLPFIIARRRPDFILVEPGPSALGAVWKPLMYPLKSKIVLDIRSIPVEVTGFRSSLNALWFNMAIALAKNTFDGITILTESMKGDVCHRFRVDPSFVGVFTSGVSTTLFTPRRYDGMDMRRKLGLTGKFIVFYHGNLSAKRGIIEAAEAMGMLKADYPDVIFFVLGNGPALPDLRRTVEERRMHDRVILHDTVEYMEVPKYIAMCDVGIIPLPDLPDWRHQSPLKLLEYLAMEKAVIVTDIPAHRQVIGGCRCGVYLRGTGPKQIAMAITYAYKNRNMLRQWGSAGRSIVKKKYDWEKVAADLGNYLLGL